MRLVMGVQMVPRDEASGRLPALDCTVVSERVTVRFAFIHKELLCNIFIYHLLNDMIYLCHMQWICWPTYLPPYGPALTVANKAVGRCAPWSGDGERRSVRVTKWPIQTRSVGVCQRFSVPRCIFSLLGPWSITNFIFY